MIVAGQRQHAAVGRCPGRVGVFEGIHRAIHARAFAVPYAEHAIDLGAGEHPDLLTAPHRRCGEILVQPGRELDGVRLQERFGAPQRMIVHAERRAAISRYEAGGIEVLQAIGFALQHRKAHQRLGAGQKNPLGIQPILVIETDRHQRHA